MIGGIGQVKKLLPKHQKGHPKSGSPFAIRRIIISAGVNVAAAKHLRLLILLHDALLISVVVLRDTARAVSRAMKLPGCDGVPTGTA